MRVRHFICVCIVRALPDAGKNASASAELPRKQWAPPLEVPLWDISNCILEDGQILISPDDEVLPSTKQTHSTLPVPPLEACLSHQKQSAIKQICIAFNQIYLIL